MNFIIELLATARVSQRTSQTNVSTLTATLQTNVSPTPVAISQTITQTSQGNGGPCTRKKIST